jgi:phage/plasmid-like protein (TIGR03299 family)
MADRVETMAYANEVPWHGFGFKVNDDLTPAQMLKAAKLDWTVSKRPTYFQNAKGVYTQIKEDFVLVRDSDEKRLANVGSVYKPVQNAEAMEFFAKFVKAGHMKMETAGSLWDGRYVWGLARIGKDFNLGGKTKDQVAGYLLMASPHVRGKAMIMQFTPIRVVCWNTLNFALGSGLHGKAGAFRMWHSQKFDDAMKARAETTLGLAQTQMGEFEQAALLLTKARAKPSDVEDYFCEVLKFNPKAKAAAKARKKKAEEEQAAKEPRKLEHFRQALTHAPGSALPTATGTWWGALNAVTYVVDHNEGRERSTALRSAWLGTSAVLKRRALDLAIKRAK